MTPTFSGHVPYLYVIESTRGRRGIVRTFNADTGHVAGVMGYDYAAVKAQLAKVLASPHFRNSKRSLALLRFVVEAAQNVDQNSLKERCIGAAVFGRETSYDTAQDPIVRNAAIEVRKRLAQYYLEPAHAGELRIELPLGSYVPLFVAEMSATGEEAEQPTVGQRRHNWKWAITIAGTLLLVAAGAFLWSSRRTPASELDAFWEPLFRDRSAVQICVGQPTRLYRFTGPRIEDLNRLLTGPASPERKLPDLSIAPDELTWVAPEYVFLRDAYSGFNIASWIQSKGRPYQLISVSQTNYSRLRHAPMVAIGAFNNTWSMRVTAELRFVFDRRTIGGVAYNCIIDRRDPSNDRWKVTQPVARTMTQDYAIVTRVFDPTTEKTVISAAGIETFGTLAASEFVTQPEYAGRALLKADSGWRHKNVQFVLTADIIDGTPGPARVLATQIW
jgi:hypothetical protein